MSAPDIAKQLRAWRKRKNLSQSGAAERIGVNVATLRNWEQARNEPRGLARRKLEEILDAEEQ